MKKIIIAIFTLLVFIICANNYVAADTKEQQLNTQFQTYINDDIYINIINPSYMEKYNQNYDEAYEYLAQIDEKIINTIDQLISINETIEYQKNKEKYIQINDKLVEIYNYLKFNNHYYIANEIYFDYQPELDKYKELINEYEQLKEN